MSKLRCSPLLSAVAVGCFFMTIIMLRNDRQRLYETYYAPIMEDAPRKTLLNDVFNATLGFEKIFVVGLPSRTDRRDNMLLQAAISDMSIEFIDGVSGDDVPEKAVPMDESEEHLKAGNLGSWRAHMNAVAEIVRRNLTSAIILEDDLDWDIRLKEQLRDFALSTRTLIQPLRDSGGMYADHTYPHPPPGSEPEIPDIDFDRMPATIEPEVSPYGDGWDALWIGHCGLSFPFPESDMIPKGRVIHFNDKTVPARKNLWSWNSPFVLTEKYPEHTRAVSHAQEGLCTLGYALSQSGARKLLADVALKPPKDAFDFLLRFYCEGRKGRNYHNCLGLQPGLFHHFKMAGPLSASSDIGNHKGFREVSSSDMIRWSVRLNADKLMNGETDFDDQFPDEESET